MCLGVTKSILKHGFMIQIHVNSFSNLYGIFDQTNSFYIHIINMKYTTLRTYLHNWVGGEWNYVCDICIKSYAIENSSMPFDYNFQIR